MHNKTSFKMKAMNETYTFTASLHNFSNVCFPYTLPFLGNYAEALTPVVG